jgi:hypothetical protein
MSSNCRPYTLPDESLRLKWGAFIPITWFFILQPYLSPLPTNTDLQPVGLLLACVILLGDAIYKGGLPRKFLLLLLFSVFVELVHTIVFQKVAVVYIATYIFLAFIWQHSYALGSSMLRWVMAWHLFGIVWQSVDHNSFSAVFDHFLRELKHNSNSVRGATGFTPEPTFAGALSTVYALVYFCFLCHADKAGHKLFFFGMYLFSIFLTSSTLGYIFLPFVLIAIVLQQSNTRYRGLKVAALLLLILCVAVSVFNLTAVNQRGLVFVKKLVSTPELVFLDSSLQERFRSLYIGFHVMSAMPLGLGHGNFPAATEWAEENLNLTARFSESRNIKGSASGAGSVMAGAGILGAGFYVLVLFSLMGRRTSVVDLGVWSVALGMFTFSFSPAFPLIYLLLVLRKKYERIYHR